MTDAQLLAWTVPPDTSLSPAQSISSRKGLGVWCQGSAPSVLEAWQARAPSQGGCHGHLPGTRSPCCSSRGDPSPPPQPPALAIRPWRAAKMKRVHCIGSRKRKGGQTLAHAEDKNQNKLVPVCRCKPKLVCQQ